MYNNNILFAHPTYEWSVSCGPEVYCCCWWLWNTIKSHFKGSTVDVNFLQPVGRPPDACVCLPDGVDHAGVEESQEEDWNGVE